MTGVDVEHTKALEAAATPGPWSADHRTDSDHDWAFADITYVDPRWEGLGPQMLGYVDLDEADAEFIAHARTALPALVAAVERVQALHSPWPSPSIQTYCRTCAHPMPCPTIRALETPK